MITGPSGSGKEVLSRYVHDKSPRASGPFVAINCAAIPDSMLEATLFGYEKELSQELYRLVLVNLNRLRVELSF